MAYIGSGSIEFQGTRVELRKRLLISGSIGANTKAFLNGSAQIRLSGGDGGPAIGSITTVLGVDHPWESYMELDCSRVAADPDKKRVMLFEFPLDGTVIAMLTICPA